MPNKPLRQVQAFFILSVLALVGLTLLLIGWAMPEMERASELDHHGKNAVAEVLSSVARERMHAGDANYSFIVHGKRYFGQAEPVPLTDFIDVRYLASDPRFSAANSAENAKSAREKGFLIITAVTMLLFTTTLLTREIVRRK